ncbi:sigma 54-interacting transcriptional regulator [Sorangium sp. So ce315]|uniref:sigma 54-interacting transcriptional regulator n=1 Tax=Sorangium sp. So ce315 TaxID=3133299 RepID=UPI003F6413E0
MVVRRTGLTTLAAATTQHPDVGSPRRACTRLVPALTVLYHPDLERVGERAVLADLALRDAVALSRMEPYFGPPATTRCAPLGDTHLSRRPLRIIALPDGRIRLCAAEGRMRAAVDGTLLEGSRDLSLDEVARGAVIELAERVVLLLHMMDPSPPEPGERLGLVGDNDLLERIRRDIRRVADLSVAVLLRGETGTGKELVARAIHQAGNQRDQPFIAVNMAAIPPSLAAAELFGAVRGSYTGAVRSRPGYFGLAEGGTLFLDEIGEAPPDVQAMLLRALETGELQAVGAQQPRKTRVRLITATDVDLDAKVAEGAFRAPLLHRLAGYEITLPPLRRRRDDIGRLLLHFLREELTTSGEAHRLDSSTPDGAPWLPASLVARLARHDWPGNVRQLRNVIRQLVVGNRGAPRLDEAPAIEHLLDRAAPEQRSHGDGANAAAGKGGQPKSATAALATSGAGKGAGWRKPSDVREEELIDALRRSRWDFKAAAEQLGVSRTSLYALVESCPQVRQANHVPADEVARCYRECGGHIDAMVDRLRVSKRALQRRIRELRLA